MKKLNGIKEKRLDKNLFCNIIKQYEGFGAREGKVIERDSRMFWDASRQPGGSVSKMWQEGVSM